MIDRIRKWRLPVRYKVPPRNDLIAFALMALAFGLMVGLAIAPGWGNAGSTGPVIALPGGESAETGTTGDTATEVAAELQPPAGGEVTKVANTDGGSTTSLADSTTNTTTDLTGLDDPEPEAPAEETPEEPYGNPPAEEPVPESPDPGPALTATVVGSDDAGYAVADSAGNLLFIHYPNPVATEPKFGKRIATDIDPVDNGTFAQNGPLESKGSASTSKLNGMVTFIDEDSGVITVSSGGVSLAVASSAAIEKSASPPEPGSWINGTISFTPPKSSASAEVKEAPEDPSDPAEEEVEDPLTIPRLTMKSIVSTGDPLEEIELNGPVTWDMANRILTIGADSFGALNREIEIRVPKKLPLKGIEDGLGYAASATPDASGNLTLTGLSANFSLKAAADPEQAFGTHSR